MLSAAPLLCFQSSEPSAYQPSIPLSFTVLVTYFETLHDREADDKTTALLASFFASVASVSIQMLANRTALVLTKQNPVHLQHLNPIPLRATRWRLLHFTWRDLRSGAKVYGYIFHFPRN